MRWEDSLFGLSGVFGLIKLAGVMGWLPVFQLGTGGGVGNGSRCVSHDGSVGGIVWYG